MNLRNEPAVLVGLVVAAVLAASEFLIGWSPGDDWTLPLGKALGEGLAVLAGTGIIRQVAYGPKTVDEIMDAEKIISKAEAKDSDH